MALTIQDATIITVEGFEAQIGKSSEFPTDPSTLHTPKVGNVSMNLCVDAASLCRNARQNIVDE